MAACKKSTRKSSKGHVDVAFELDCGNGPVMLADRIDDKPTVQLLLTEDDARLLFLCNYVTRSLRVKREKWLRLMHAEEQNKTLVAFLEESHHSTLFATTAYNGSLLVDFALAKLSTQASNKVCFFVKKRVGSVSSAPHDLIYGDLGASLIANLVAFNEQVYYPLIRTHIEHQQWLRLAADGVDKQLNEFNSALYQLKGSLDGITLLPIPHDTTLLGAATRRLSNEEMTESDLALKSTIDAYLSKWSAIIDGVAKQSSATILSARGHSGPSEALAFWRRRLHDLRNIFKQLEMQDAKDMLAFAAVSCSAYIQPFQTAFKGLIAHIAETKQIANYMGALSELFGKCEQQQQQLVLHDTLLLFASLLHGVGLLWQNCEAVQKNEQVAITLLQCIGNAIIRMMSRALDPASLFLGDAEESITRIRQATIAIERHFLHAYEMVKHRLRWSFPAVVLFKRVLRFKKRLQLVESLLATFVTYNRLEKIELGGSRGCVLNAQLLHVYERFLAAFQRFQHVQRNVLDLDDRTICGEAEEFADTCKHFDQRLASIFALAFDDCGNLEACCKFIAVLGAFGQRAMVRKLLQPKYGKIVVLLEQELDALGALLHHDDDHYDYLPPLYAKLLRCKQVERRLRQSMQSFGDLDAQLFHTIEEDRKRSIRKGEALAEEIESVRRGILSGLEGRLRTTIATGEKRTLLTAQRDHKMMLNLDPNYLQSLREMKYISLHDDAFVSDGLRLEATKRIMHLLHQSVIMYEDLCNRTSVEEMAIIQDELSMVRDALQPALTRLTWRSVDAQDVCSHVHSLIRHLHARIVSAQHNFCHLQKSVESINNEMICAPCVSLINDVDRRLGEMAKRARNVEALRVHCDITLKVNFALLHNLIAAPAIKHPTLSTPSQLYSLFQSVCDAGYAEKAGDNIKWDAYLSRVHTMIRTIVVDALLATLQRLAHDMKPKDIRSSSSELFVIRVELVAQQIITMPSIDESDEQNCFSRCIDATIDDIIDLAMQMPTLQPEDIDDQLDVGHWRNEIRKCGQSLMVDSKSYLSAYQQYEQLWSSVQEDCLAYFLKYGQTISLPHWPTSQQLNAAGEVEKTPTLEDFKVQISYFENLHDDLAAINATHTISGCLMLDLQPLKQALMSLALRWAHLFKQHLSDTVLKGIRELETFIEEAVGVMSRPIAAHDLPAMIRVMGILSRLKERRLITDNIFQPLQMMIDLLKFFDADFPEEVCVRLLQLPFDWEQCKRLAHVTRQIMAPLQASEVSSIRRSVCSFDVQQLLYREQFKHMPIFRYDCDSIYVRLDRCNRTVVELEGRMLDLCKQADLFELQVPEFKHVLATRRDLKLLKGLWDYVALCNSWIDEWRRAPWKQIDVEAMDMECKRFSKDLRAMDKDLRSWDVYVQVEAHLKNMLTSLRAVTDLQSPSIRERHWNQLMQTIQIAPHSKHCFTVKFVMDPQTSLNDLLALRLHEYEEEVRTVVDTSIKEVAMEKTLKDLHETWTMKQFAFEVHERTATQILHVADDLVQVLDEHQVQLQNLMTSKCVHHFYAEISAWQTQLANVDQVISLFVEVQRKWGYLESIFIGSEDIRNQIADDAHRFDAVDATFKATLQRLRDDDASILAVANQKGFGERLEEQLQDLVQCEKALNDYLECKRREFPRFYFISAADLLDILSNGNQPALMQRHLAKLFESLAQLEFATDRRAIAMLSKDSFERVPFVGECRCEGKVEIWLNWLVDAMKDTLRSLFASAVASYEGGQTRDAWIFENAAQVALVGIQIWWSAEITAAFGKLEEGYDASLKDYHKQQVLQLNALIAHLLGDLSPGDRQKIMTICTIDVHSRDVVAKLIALKVESAQAFQWQSQLRHRWDESQQQCYGNICDAQIEYQYEYLGNTPRLVITPLTDRCYITLTQSLHLAMGGAPAGPAGTGKTETTKDLGKALGIMVYVFNCSEQMDYKSVGNIYKGLVQTGTWGCFDEFNRIAVEVLSVVAVQVKTIQDAIKQGRTRFRFLGEDIKLVASVGIFITMNPGYAGRTELPENLKALFRPCAMVVPDFELICEIMLVAEGFQEARVLARKFITMYTLCKELLSKQDHYDWGLRAIKSVLVVAGALKRDDRQRCEDHVLMRALRDFNLPKIVCDDMPIFMGLIRDLFPTLEVPRKRNFEFEKMVKKSTVDLQLQPEEAFVLKVVQLEELFAVRHSVFIIGAAGSGKSAVWRTLSKMYANQKRRPIVNDLNPKAVSNDELFGVINPTTREWHDGLFSAIMREQANTPGSAPRWIILDGDIDPMWIESLNTLMDDNRVLTLASNERIALTPSMRLLFEIANLRTATPATVSRAGILHINPTDLGWHAFVASWMDVRGNPGERAVLSALFDKYVPPCLEHVGRGKLRRVAPLVDVNYLMMLCQLLDCFITPENVPADSASDVYEMYFVFCAIWAFGASVATADGRVEFSKWFTSEFKTIGFTAERTVFDSYIDPASKSFKSWFNIVAKFELNADIPLQATLVDTMETRRVRYLLQHLMARRVPCMLMGPAGTGKTALMLEQLASLDDSDYLSTHVPLNFYTSSQMLQTMLEKPLEKKAGRVFAPPGNKQMVFFIDDMNVPEVDRYFTVLPHTLLRQHIDYQHWYDRQKLTLKEVQNIQYVACMNPTAGAFQIDARLQRHFCVFAVDQPADDMLFAIYHSILRQRLRQANFNTLMHKMCVTIVNAALTLHAKVCANFLPTAIKFHYVFHLRDLSNVFQGMLFPTGDTIVTQTDFIRLWLHESQRVYGDKLVSAKDGDMFAKLLNDVTKKHFEELDEGNVMAQPLIFCHFAEGIGDPKYVQVRSYARLHRLLMEAQASYNDLVAAMNLVLFEDAMHHVCRINRVLEAARGHLLLVGVGGTGKQSLTRLAAFIAALDVFQVQLGKDYSVADMRQDIAGLYLKTGTKNVASAFLMSDSQVVSEECLVLVNCMLASGEIPDLLTDDETDEVLSVLKSEVKAAGMEDTRENCWRFYIDKVRRLVKVVLCFSPVGSVLRVRARKFPALLNCTTINWFHDWPKEALLNVSKRFFADITTLPASHMDGAAEFMSFVHTSVNRMSQTYLVQEKRHNYTTPKTFLEQIALYARLLTNKAELLKNNVHRLENGLLALDSTAKEVDELQSVLAVQEVALAQKNEAADKLIGRLRVENEAVAKEQVIACEEEARVRIIEEDVAVKAKTCAEDLRKAEPALAAAMAALDTLNKSNLTELKSFGSPPDAVVNVCAAVLVLFARKGKLPKDRSWKACKSLMGKVDQFLSDLLAYDKEHIHPDVVRAVLPYVNDPDFDPHAIRSKSTAAGGLCAWVINIIKYHDVFLVVEPKRRALDAATEALRAARQTLRHLKEKLRGLELQLATLRGEHKRAAEAKLQCQQEADSTAAMINLARRLIDGLAAEKLRWGDSVERLNGAIYRLPGDMLLVTAFVTYVGCFTRIYRVELVQQQWLPRLNDLLPVTEDLDPLTLLTDDVLVAKWHNDGLPADRMSIENAAILAHTTRWPLMIDPQLQGVKWIKKRYGADLTVVRLTARNYMDTIERSLSAGSVVLLENIGESIDGVLDPVLGRVLVRKGRCIRIGGKEIDYDDRFRLIIQTKLGNPHYKPEIQAQTTLINFTVTRGGLEEQLLAEVVKCECPDLERSRASLTRQQNAFQITLKTCEDNLLERLSSASGNILADDALVVHNLETTKRTASEISAKAAEAQRTSSRIDEAREQYRPAAARAALLYFLLNDLQRINPIYVFSLKAYTGVFTKSLRVATPATALPQRVHNLLDSITSAVCTYTSRGLFERDRLVFLAQLTLQILHARNEMPASELDFLLRFPVAAGVCSPCDFVSDVQWGGVKALAQLDEFKALDVDIEGSMKRWRKFVASECPEREKLPGEWKSRTALQQLCIMRCLRPDRMTYAMRAFIEVKLGAKFVRPRAIPFDESFAETSSCTPILFILSPGVNPLTEVARLGYKLGYSQEAGNLHNVALGQGQEVIAEAAMDSSAAIGHWVILHNIHLVERWLPMLEKKMELQQQETTHPDYRLYLSAEATAVLPLGVLESSIKITNEPPTGMHANLHKALDNFSQAHLEVCSKEAEFRSILFALCYFHAVVIERGKFGPQGWNRAYPFNIGDLAISVNVLHNYLENSAKVPWEDLRYLFGEIMYGGHITDDWDRRLCRNYLMEYMQPALLEGELCLAQGFKAPLSCDYHGYHRYVDECLPPESPHLYGLHPNAEIGFLTAVSDAMFRTILEMQSSSLTNTAASNCGTRREEKVRAIVDDMLEKLPEAFGVREMMAKMEDRSPYVIVCLQECERMNNLLEVMRTTLRELQLGLKGELTITLSMETLEGELFLDQVPQSWTRHAYASLLPLARWYADLHQRIKELDNWSQDFAMPAAVWLGGLFNPQSFLTAIKQQMARRNELPLDKMCLQAHVTSTFRDDLISAPREGANIYGLHIEGARWDIESGALADAILQDLCPPMPVIFLRAITQDKEDRRSVYECPVYKTPARGHTYVWTFNLRTQDKPSKWVLAGVALLLQL